MFCKFVNNALLHEEIHSRIRTRQDGHWESAVVVGKSIEKVNLLVILNVSTLLFAVFLFLKAFARISVLKKLVKTLLNSKQTRDLKHLEYLVSSKRFMVIIISFKYSISS